MTNPPEKKEKAHLGYAVRDGVIRFLSVSQITTFDASQEGGCQRRWGFQKLFGKKEPSSESQDAGKEYAASLEHYLTTGEDILVPVLRAGKHLFPKPGPDLECERELLGDDPVKAIETKTALLMAAGIPITGAADVRHRRGVYVDFDGLVRREDPGMLVAEIDDLKTTSRISNHTDSKGKVQKGYAKTIEQILVHPQMVGYGVHAANLYPEITHVRLGHIYCQTKHGYAAVKRHSLLPVEEVRRRWERVEAVVREMKDMARVKRPEDIPYNLKACNSYNKECPHMSYCDRPNAGVADLFQLRAQRAAPVASKGEPMSGLFASLGQPQTPAASNGVATPPLPTGGLFGGAVPAAPPIPVAPAQSDAERAAIVAAERARLEAEDAPALPRKPLEGVEGYTVGQKCNGRAVLLLRVAFDYPIELVAT